MRCPVQHLQRWWRSTLTDYKENRYYLGLQNSFIKWSSKLSLLYFDIWSSSNMSRLLSKWHPNFQTHFHSESLKPFLCFPCFFIPVKHLLGWKQIHWCIQNLINFYYLDWFVISILMKSAIILLNIVLLIISNREQYDFLSWIVIWVQLYCCLDAHYSWQHLTNLAISLYIY